MSIDEPSNDRTDDVTTAATKATASPDEAVHETLIGERSDDADQPDDGAGTVADERSGSKPERPRVVVASASGLGVATEEGADPASLVEEPAKVMRIGTMIKQLLEEVRSAPLDEAARERLAEIHERSLHELEAGLSADLVAELHRITLPFTDDRAPSDAELRIAQAQLVGWLEGLFHGIQTALVAQQMAAQNQLVGMRALPPGASHPPMGTPGQADDRSNHGTGQYL
ncbi:bacterial proteasome activator family protein [Occultella kanbiaonis]|uniref:bacterial proteasome activator family protein n=1 Tax=Occultella kanbiaonis TaxID=2675754 RepID=UPI001E3192B3|nr:bacterial proteasome activator family protein [Occultella kanbiaonis]